MSAETDGRSDCANYTESDGNEAERVSSEIMDEKRQENIAYQYLCHLEEARLWIQSCIEEELPPVTELEENFRNGVYLAKLAHRISPNTVPAKKIYDPNQEMYLKKGLHFRHTDNINHWLKAMEDVGLPPHFHPDTFDVYDKRNIPKMVYCLHALSLYLFQLGRAPRIQDLYGRLHFSTEQIRAMERQFERDGVVMPDFGKIRDSICRANKQVTVDKIGAAILSGDVPSLREALASLAGEVEIDPGNVDAYLQFLGNLYKDRDVSWERLLSTVAEANRNVNIQNFVNNFNLALDYGDKEMLIKYLQNSPEPLDIIEAAVVFYMEEFCVIRKENGHNLTYKEIMGGLKVLTAIAQINQILVNKGNLFEGLTDKNAHICGVNVQFVSQYEILLLRMRKDKILKGFIPFLNHYEIQEAVDKVNKQILNREAIRRINRTIRQNDCKKLFKVLSCPEASILCVEPKNSDLYQFLFAEKQSKCKDEYIYQEEIQCIVNEANRIALDANCTCVTIITVNNAVKDENSSILKEALQMLNLVLSDNLKILPHCIDNYLENLKKLKIKKEKWSKNLDKDDIETSWITCQLHNYFYSFNVKTLDCRWMRPQLGVDSCYLDQNDITSIVTGVNSEDERKQFLKFIEPKIVILQSYARGFLTRSHFSARMNSFKLNVDKIIKIQAWWRGLIQRRKYLVEKHALAIKIQKIIKVQSYVRRWLAKRHFRSLLLKERAAKKIQLVWRSFKTRKDFKLILHSSAPPLRVVHKFVYLLSISDEDYKDELDLQKMRNKVVQTIKYNQKLEKEVNDMDLKIAMLIKNHLTLQEVISQRKRTLTGKKDAQLSDISWLGNKKGLGALSKNSRTKLEAFQHLFYTLQTEPRYLAKLLLIIPINQASKFIESLILTLYNYGSTPRDEYLLLCLFRTALEEEIKTKVDHVVDILTGNPLVIKMIVGFNRNGQGQICLRELLGPVIKQVIEDKNLHINTNPVEIYKLWINEMETQTGKMSSYPYVITQSEALQHEEVKNRLDRTIRDLKEKTLLFFDTIIHSLNKIPYGILYMAKILKNALHNKFPDVTDKEILKVVGNLLYYRYINSAIAAPDAFDIIDVGLGNALTIEQRRNLASIAKLLQFAASGKKFSSDSHHLTCLNSFLKKCHEKFKEFFRKACTVEEPEAYFKMDCYSEAALIAQPTIYISVQELCDVHCLLLQYEDEIAPKSSDPLHQLLSDLGLPSTVKSLMGEDLESMPTSTIGQTEVCLTLTNKFLVNESESSDVQQVYVKTKQMIIDLLHYRNVKETLLDLLNTKPSQEEELKFANSKENLSLSKNVPRFKISKTVEHKSLYNLQKDLLHNLSILELAEFVSRKDNYQTIINDIGKDICNRHYYKQCCQKELKKLTEAQEKLNKKLSFYEDKLECYNQYIKRCLDNLSSGKKKVHFKNLFFKNNKEQEVKCKICLRYTGAKLYEKGILLEITDIDHSQLKNVTFDITPTEEMGVFFVCAKFMGVAVEKVELDIQDLLQLQYEGVAIMKMFGRAKVNVNLLLYLLNSKFYSKGL
ncbi:ras GTPase-activating-like protein IQGAP2 [Centruroides vittatus]|uniref:ras GTPase-activating-like protein IQGAP2 n=1 Tax=Centruroides vittatus TaxID=120091 RepID=UPI0035109BBB